MMQRPMWQAVACMSVILVAGGLSAAAVQSPPPFTEEQAAAGQAVYQQHCANCHGPALEGAGQFGPPLTGERFTTNWRGKKLSEYFTRVRTTMPPGRAGAIDARSYAQVVAYTLKANGMAAGTTPLPLSAAAQADFTLPASSVAAASAPAPVQSAPPPPPARSAEAAMMAARAQPQAPAVAPERLRNLSAVTDAMLRSPPAEDWLIWRRTYDSQGFSPLKQITDRNVKSLSIAWSWSLAAGPMEATPIVHDGILFIQSGTDTIQALDAATGDLLWNYVRTVPPEVANAMRGLSSIKRNMAIAGTTLLVATADTYVIALDTRSGALLWEHPIADAKQRWYLSAGPVVVKDKVIQGVSGSLGRQPDGNAIITLDIKTGKEVWRFNTVARPGEPGGDSWNGLPLEKRSGASVWIAGSYDPELNLVFFGTGNSYDSQAFRKKSSPEANIDLLYTNTTLALNPDTGKLVWHFQHMPNDLLDLDWAFERTIMTINGRKLVATGGKTALFDALDAATGKYVVSHDLGLQNVATADPVTGVKTLNPALFKDNSPTGLVCPGSLGARNWMATSYNPTTRIMYVPMDELCGGGRMVPRPGHDGKFGQLAAIDFQSGKIIWRNRSRATQTAAALATAGNVVFNADLDRWFRANNARTGAELWKVRLNDTAHSFPITYMVKGKQYVAIPAGGVKPFLGLKAAATPEIKTPPSPGDSVLWVFALGGD